MVKRKNLRVGIGYDAHRLVKGRKLILGGVNIPHTRGLAGHSDADVLSHSIADAILGAVGLGDIGHNFPDTYKKYKNISSLKLLQTVKQKIKSAKLINIDASIIAQEPKLFKYIPEMKNNLAAVLKIPLNSISIKAKTTEGMGFEGRKEGMSTYAVVLISL